MQEEGTITVLVGEGIQEKKRRENIDTDIVRSESFGMSVAFVIDYAAAVDEMESIQ